ncbi:MAG: thioredoxin domain-containing protein [Candidatus Dormiibacterota bacterium]
MAAPTVIDVTDHSFDRDVVDASRRQPVVVDFWAAWCGPCRSLGPILEDAVTRHGGITLAKLDVDSNQATAARFRIQGIPAVKGFRDGGLAAEFVGLQPRAQVERFLAQLAPPPPPAPLPAGEAQLAAVLESDSGNLPARRALATLLTEQGRLDEAESVLADAPADPACDGLRARIELLRGGDPSLRPLVSDGSSADRVRELIACLRGRGEPERSQLRRVVIGAIASEPSLEALRAELASALF